MGFLSSHEGKFFRLALHKLSELGYYVDAFTVDAKHFTPAESPAYVHRRIPARPITPPAQ